MVSSTNCCGFFTGSSRSKTWSSKVKIAVFAPIPSAKVSAATAANPRLRRKVRSAYPKSRPTTPIHSRIFIPLLQPRPSSPVPIRNDDRTVPSVLCDVRFLGPSEAPPFLAVRALLRYSAAMPSERERSTLPSLPAEAALSFLKDTKGTLTWSARDLADTLKINRREAQQALAFLQAQGYVQPARRGEPAHQKGSARSADQWITTPAGETVSGAKPPRFTRESVEQALVALKNRIKQSNKDL